MDEPEKLAAEVRRLVECAVKGDNPDVVTRAILAALRPADESKAVPSGDMVEEVISAWAFAHNIDGALRNDLFTRIRARLADESRVLDYDKAVPSADHSDDFGPFDKADCLKCGTNPHAIELCDDCERKFLAALSTNQQSNTKGQSDGQG